MKLTKEIVQKATGASEEIAEKWMEAIAAVGDRAKMEPLVMADYMIRMGKASKGLTSLQDDFLYSADDLAAARPQKYSQNPHTVPVRGNAAAVALVQSDPEGAAKIIGGDDAWAYRGVGPVRLKGKEAITAFGESTDQGAVDPESLKEPENGALSAAYALWPIQPVADRVLRTEIADAIIAENAPPPAEAEPEPVAAAEPEPAAQVEESKPPAEPKPGKKRRATEE